MASSYNTLNALLGAAHGNSAALGALAREQCLLALRHRSASVRAMALEGLARHGQPDDIAAVVGLLWDRDFLVRVAALELIDQYGASRWVAVLRSLLQDGDACIRGSAAEVLLPVAPSSLTHIQELYRKERHPMAKIRFGGALLQAGDPRAVAYLLKMVHHRVRTYAELSKKFLADADAGTTS